MNELPKGNVAVELEIEEIFAMKLDILCNRSDTSIF